MSPAPAASSYKHEKIAEKHAQHGQSLPPQDPWCFVQSIYLPVSLSTQQTTGKMEGDGRVIKKAPKPNHKVW
jgi:hypothetical protein